MKRLKKKLLATMLVTMLPVAITTPALEANASTLELKVDAAHPSKNTSPDLYGIFFEDINHAADGGLYAELVQNRSFEDNSTTPAHWSLVTKGSAAGAMNLDGTNLVNSTQAKALRLDIAKAGANETIGIANDGYWGISVKQGLTYDLALFAKANSGFSGSITATLESADGQTVYGQVVIPKLNDNWQKYTAKISASGTDPKARLVLSANTPGSIWFDVVSLFPPTFKNRTNGLRQDLAEMTKALKPSFMRFPGGCFVEGDKMEEAFRWKTTIGKVEERPGHHNLWGYRTTDGMGYHEFLQLSEDIGAKPLYVINIGVAHKDNIPLDKIDPWIQDALDSIEYANGDVTTKYGALRAANGHPEPFNLQYIEIGNENNQYNLNDNKSDLYGERYLLFSTAIKLKYPDIKFIGNVQAWGTDNPSWRFGSKTDMVDEHYYRGTQWFIDKATKYDSYDRKGPGVYVGEYAVTKKQDCGKGNLNAALGEAAYMTGLERNSDIVKMSSYAPLFVNTNDRKWSPDAIVYNSSSAFGTPTYYVQKMFSNNVGNVLLPTALNVTVAAKPQAEGKRDPLYYVTSLDQKSGDIIIKVVNTTNEAADTTIDVAGIKRIVSASASAMSSDNVNDENTFDNPTKVVPVDSKVTVKLNATNFNYTFQKNSVTVLRIKPAK